MQRRHREDKRKLHAALSKQARETGSTEQQARQAGNREQQAREGQAVERQDERQEARHNIYIGNC
jgi:hypothetical protein